MRTLFKIILMICILQGCKPQSDFDLIKLTLRSEKVNSLVSDIKKKQIEPYGNTGNEYVILKNDEFLNFNGTNLIGRQNADSNYGINGVSFFYNKKDSIIYQYHVSIYSEKQAEDLLHSLYEKLGEPNYTSYMKVKDKMEDNFDALLWEDTINNHLYLLRYGLDGTVKAALEVKNNSINIQELNMMGPFGYWEDYLYERKQKNDLKFTYQDYLAEQLQMDPDDFKNQLTK